MRTIKIRLLYLINILMGINVFVTIASGIGALAALQIVLGIAVTAGNIYNVIAIRYRAKHRPSYYHIREMEHDVGIAPLEADDDAPKVLKVGTLSTGSDVDRRIWFEDPKGRAKPGDIWYRKV